MSADQPPSASSRRSGRPDRIAAHAALVLFGLFAGLLAIELLLQTGAVLVRAAGRTRPSSWGTSHRRFLCLGDSNTYGVYVEEHQAYPHVLEQLWNARRDVAPIEVMNLGFPGTNSSHIRNALPKLLSMFHPDVVTVMVGGNDWWTAPEPMADAPGTRARLDTFLWRVSRLYRLLYMLRRSSQTPRIDIPRPPTGVPGPAIQLGTDSVEWHVSRGWDASRDWRSALRENLVAIGREVPRSGAEPVLITYPADLPISPLYGRASAIVREAAKTANVRLIDLGQAITPRCSGGTCEELYPDHHPTAKGHRLAAKIILRELRKGRQSARAGSRAGAAADPTSSDVMRPVRARVRAEPSETKNTLLPSTVFSGKKISKTATQPGNGDPSGIGMKPAGWKLRFVMKTGSPGGREAISVRIAPRTRSVSRRASTC